VRLGGSKKENGMASFADLLSPEEAERIHQYIISRALRDREEAAQEKSTTVHKNKNWYG